MSADRPPSAVSRRIVTALSAVGALAAAVAGPAAAAPETQKLIVESYDDPVLLPDWGLRADPGWSIGVVDGRLEMTKAAGTVGGRAESALCRVRLDGDFVLEARASIVGGSAPTSGSFGVLVDHPDTYAGSFSNVFFTAAGTVGANVGTPAGFFSGAGLVPASGEAILRIERAEGVVTAGFDPGDGTGFRPLVSQFHPVLTEPVGVLIFHLEETGSGAPRFGAIDDVTITFADPFVPGPDLVLDGAVDVDDLLELLAAWGPCPEAACCPADVNADGAVDFEDLLALLSAWG